jgi:NitT/TauT family transport system substrate-binding protein
VTPVPATLKVGTLLLLIDAPIALAIERGYFSEVGITLELQQFDSIANEIPLLGTGQLDIALEGASSAGFFNALARGVALKMVATQGAASGGHTFNGVVAAKPLMDSGQVKRAADLRGKTVNILLEGVFAQLMVDKALAADGLTLADVDQQKVPFPDTLAALRNQSLDASFLVEPFITLGKQQGLLDVLSPGEVCYPGHEVSVILYSQSFAQRQPVASNFMVAYLRGVRDYHRAFFTGTADRAAAVAQMVKYLPVKEPALYERMGMPFINPDGYINVADFEAQQAWYVAQGQVQQSAALQPLVDHTFIDFAQKVLGPYTP